ncbi:MAG: pseudouridine synthase [Muribaculaceae bacterium]
MDENVEKKARRPRIGESKGDIVENNNDTHYDMGSYGQDRVAGDKVAASSDYTPSSTNYNPRNYSNRQGGYNNNRQGGYGNNRQGGYNNRQGGYNRNYNPNANYDNQDLQGGYGNNRQGGYNNNRQGGYNNNRQGGYNNNRQGGYNNRQGGYNNNNRQGGYNNRQGGYNNNNRQGGYGNNNRQGGYNNNNRQQRRGNNRQQNNGPRPQMRFTPRPQRIEYVLPEIDPNEPIRLNKFMANAGVCSRREADELIQQGVVKVNGVPVTELGTKITRNDVVEYNEKVVTLESKCYVLLNKPKDCVTTSDDPNGRTTVMDLVKGACTERIYPVGRLDRNTTGVLLLTNDGDLASKLTHPKFVKKKIYQVWTDKPISEDDMQRIADGIELDDGPIHADAVSYVSPTDRKQAGIEIHSGRNRVVRRIFETLGYHVVKLDRVYFAGLTKKNLARGKWRYLTQEEVNFLKQGSFE